MNEFDFVAIGDTVIDAFIRLKEAEVHCRLDHTACEICMRFGDKIPYESVTIIPGVGNSANAAVSATRLGLKTAFVSNVGDDEHGREILKALGEEGLDTRFIQVNVDRKTNYHYVLWFADDRTILVKHEDFDYQLPDIGSPKWVYLSSTGENSIEFHAAIAKYLSDRPGVKLAFQPGTFQMKFGIENLAAIYRRSDVFFCNREEARKILQTTEDDPKKLLQMMHALGPKVVVITDGPKGAYAYDGRGPSADSTGSPQAGSQPSQSYGGQAGKNSHGEFWFMPPYPDPKPPLSRTGAGDAFSSTFTVALALGRSVPEALRLAPINSMSVVQHIGARAGLLTMADIEAYLAKAPADYQPQPL